MTGLWSGTLLNAAGPVRDCIKERAMEGFGPEELDEDFLDDFFFFFCFLTSAPTIPKPSSSADALAESTTKSQIDSTSSNKSPVELNANSLVKIKSKDVEEEGVEEEERAIDDPSVRF